MGSNRASVMGSNQRPLDAYELCNPFMDTRHMDSKTMESKVMESNPWGFEGFEVDGFESRPFLSVRKWWVRTSWVRSGVEPMDANSLIRTLAYVHGFEALPHSLGSNQMGSNIGGVMVSNRATSIFLNLNPS